MVIIKKVRGLNRIYLYYYSLVFLIEIFEGGVYWISKIIFSFDSLMVLLWRE